MKDFRKTTNWKYFTGEFPSDGNKKEILVCQIDHRNGDFTDEFTVGHLEYCPYLESSDEEENFKLGLTIFGYTYFYPETSDQIDPDLVNYVWDYLE